MHVDLSVCLAPAQVDAAVERLIKSFNTWAYKREQPSDPTSLLRIARRAVQGNLPLRFVLYWGKGPRRDIAEPDLVCLDYLAGMAERVRAVHAAGADFELLLTDTHAALNGHEPRAIQSYFTAIGAAARLRGFSVRHLSAISDAPVDLPPTSRADVPAELIESAAKWYRGPGTAADGATAYFAMNMVEKAAVERAYPDAIFVTFNNSRLRSLFPDNMPIFYMYSLRKGQAVKPWFMEPTECDEAGTVARGLHADVGVELPAG